MAQNVTIAGASYPDVPSIEMPKTGGGTAVFVDTSDANAAAGDITKGKTAYVGGTKITGTLEASSSGVAKETWVIKSDAAGEFATTQIAFTSNGQKFTSIGADYDGFVVTLLYDNNEIAGYEPGAGGVYEFNDQAYRKLTFDTSPAGALLTWLQSNATKQPDDTSVQPTKALTITSNGTVSVTPDAPYDALKKVDVTVNVASGGGGGAGFSVTFPATAKNWDKSRGAKLFLYNGSTIEINSYSTVAGKKVDGVVGLTCGRVSDSFFVLKMALASGTIVQATPAPSIDGSGSVSLGNYFATQSGGSTATPYAATSLLWWPLADTVISSIEMYNTD